VGIALLAMVLYILITTLHPGLLDDRSGPSDGYLTREPDEDAGVGETCWFCGLAESECSCRFDDED
jgi:hypothetical protein